eukprot:scaffold57598_cov59-Phaeocystis_antarctica.AAC.4
MGGRSRGGGGDSAVRGDRLRWGARDSKSKNEMSQQKHHWPASGRCASAVPTPPPPLARSRRSRPAGYHPP